jgi:hypothetical protein
VERLLRDPAVRHEMGRNGRRRAREEFGAERHVTVLLELYSTLVAA